jgi:hypothetical protein
MSKKERLSDLSECVRLMTETKNLEIRRLEEDVQKLNSEVQRLKECVENSNSLIEKLQNCNQLLNKELTQLEIEISLKENDIKELNHQNMELVSEMETQRNEFEINQKEISQQLNDKILENSKLEDEVERYKNMSETFYNEVIQLQEVVEKRQKNYKDFQQKLTKELSQQQEKCAQLENELKEEVLKVQQLQKQVIQYESLIRDYTLRLNTEEESFKMERIQKERYAKENQNLENDIKKYKAMLENVPSNNISCMPTTINVNASHPNVNATASVSQLSDVLNLSNPTIECNRSRGRKRSLSAKDSLKSDDQRVMTLQSRNKMVSPHLRTAYAVELGFSSNSVSEHFIKDGKTGTQTRTQKKKLRKN